MKIDVISSEVNSYFIIKNNKCLLVDPGYNATEIKLQLTKNKLQLLAIVLTHGHFDHILGCNEFDVPIYIHRADQDMLYDPIKNFSDFFHDEAFSLNHSKEVVTIDNDTLDIDEFHLDIIHIPGHSGGSICIYLQDLKQVIVGDCFSVRILRRPELIYGSEENFINTINEKLFSLPDDTLCLKGHSKSVPLQKEKNNKFYKKKTSMIPV